MGRNNDLVVVMARLGPDEVRPLKRRLLRESALESAPVSLLDKNALLRLIMGLAYSIPQLLLLST